MIVTGSDQRRVLAGCRRPAIQLKPIVRPRAAPTLVDKAEGWSRVSTGRRGLWRWRFLFFFDLP